MKYFDAFNMVTNAWICCVKADTPEQAKVRASSNFGIAIQFIRVIERIQSI